MGPLCDECDIFNGYTKVSKSQCFECSSIDYAIFIIVFVASLILLFIVISVDSTMKKIKSRLSNYTPVYISNRFYAAIVIK